MCTVVVKWSAHQPLRVLALRDELVGRDFDDPGAWWPDQPTVIGGRDRTAGGSWAVTDVSTGRTALVLNRPQRRVAEPGAPSRGVLPLLAVRLGSEWPSAISTTGMASFALVLASPESVSLWEFDGERLARAELEEGTRMITSGGAEDGKQSRYLSSFEARADWAELVQEQQPADDPAALVVRHEDGERVFATVFGQLMEVVPGQLRVSYSRTPWEERGWTEASFSGTGPRPANRPG